jgi:hypothetical protein
MNEARLIAVSLLMGLLTAAPHAESGNDGTPKGNNGNHYGWYKDKHVDEEEPRVDSVPEPATLGLVAAATAVVLAIAVMRRRKR